VARLRLDIDQETLLALMDRALRERRPLVLEAEVLLRQALGLPFPYPGEMNETVAEVKQESRA